MMTASEIAGYVGAELRGDGTRIIERVSSAAGADAGSMVFAETPDSFSEAVQSAAGAVLSPPNLAHSIASGQVILLVENPRLAFAQAGALLNAASEEPTAEVHATALVSSKARLGRDVVVGALAVIDDGAEIADGVHIGAGCVVGRGVVIGAGTRIYPRVVIYPGTALGEHCVVHAGAVLGADGFGYVRDPETGDYTQFPQQGTLKIGDHVDIGANTTIDRGALEATVIGDGVKIDNLVHVGHNVQIGKNVVIAAQTGISGSSVIGEGAVIAGQVGIADHVTIGEGAVLGAQCGVPSRKKISGPGVLFWGTPARPIQQYLKELAAVARLVKPKKD